MDQVREVLRYYHYAYKTEQTYVQWILKYIRFNDKRHPAEMGKEEIESFLSYLAIERKVSASTQNQAFNAILFLYKRVLLTPVNGQIQSTRAKKRVHLPTVLSRKEMKLLILSSDERYRFIIQLMYAGGLRLIETCRLRVQDLDFDNKQRVIRSGKGDKDRITLFPEALHLPMQQQLKKAKSLHEADLKKGLGEVYLPSRKYKDARKNWIWQYVFPSRNTSLDPYSTHPS